jgi:PTH2 family peptidyl-tRNA hydrolase
MTSKLQLVIVLRKDLGMRKGKMVAQGGHAVESIILDNLENDLLKKWRSTGSTKICVSVNSEEELLNVYQKAIDENFIGTIITDSGLTEFNGVPTLTCCAIGLATKEQLHHITGNLTLL